VTPKHATASVLEMFNCVRNLLASACDACILKRGLHHRLEHFGDWVLYTWIIYERRSPRCKADVKIPAQRRPQTSPKVTKLKLIVSSESTVIRPGRLPQQCTCYYLHSTRRLLHSSCAGSGKENDCRVKLANAVQKHLGTKIMNSRLFHQ